MFEIINVKVEDGRQVVSARELHEFLDSKQDFSTWIKARIKKYDFIENVDFTTFHNFVEREGSNLKSKTTEYAITIEMAKELAMVENTEKGRMARRYFIQCESLAKAFNHFYQEQIKELATRLDKKEKLIGIRSKTVFNYGKYIKNKMCITHANKEYENVKMVLFAELGVNRWEEIDYSLEVISKIDEVLHIMKLNRQMQLTV